MTRSEHDGTTINMFGGEGRERSFAPGALLLADGISEITDGRAANHKP
jgi:hypothetical protein